MATVYRGRNSDGSGSSLKMGVSRDIRDITARIQATPKQIGTAAERASKETLNWLRVRISRDLAGELGVVQKALKSRMSVKTVGEGSDRAIILWLGTASIPLEKVGTVRQTKKGVKAGKLPLVQGAFYKAVYDSEKKVWIRAHRHRNWLGGNNLPDGIGRLSSKQYKSYKYHPAYQAAGVGGNYDNSRFPVMRLGLSIEDRAHEILKRWSRQVESRFRTVFERNLNHVVNNERK
ncbi:hypothetical protein GZ77_26095 [Endozoicomonas montiporae]|uniref:Uncharacterized protein n=1 Tax=Endozoicomonas montiporae TaxID=1027273 RepID=A0A081MYL4_9GAMM|nr:hypothetical protein [Endozoicomonas montiporae]KEQ11287.1 hypothetical protein GZ77_26095 [Endozoicomonas montiporae]